MRKYQTRFLLSFADRHVLGLDVLRLESFYDPLTRAPARPTPGPRPPPADRRDVPPTLAPRTPSGPCALLPGEARAHRPVDALAPTSATGPKSRPREPRQVSLWRAARPSEETTLSSPLAAGSPAPLPRRRSGPADRCPWPHVPVPSLPLQTPTHLVRK